MRYGQMIQLQDGMLETYRHYHADVWPGVLEQIKAANISNYSIFYRAGYLFAYFEYHGDDFDADMAAMASDPETQRWWELMNPMQHPIEAATDDEWWADMEQVFHLE